MSILSYFIIKIKRGYEHLIFRVVKDDGMPSFDTDLMSQLTIQWNSSPRTLKLAHTISLTHKKVQISIFDGFFINWKLWKG